MASTPATPAGAAERVGGVEGREGVEEEATRPIAAEVPKRKTLLDIPKLPKTHEVYKNRGRCADHLQDVVDLARTPLFSPAASLFWDCLWSSKGYLHHPPPSSPSSPLLLLLLLLLIHPPLLPLEGKRGAEGGDTLTCSRH